MTFVPSPEQQAIFDYVLQHKDESGRKALAVSALAGTGKTTTILEIIKQLGRIKGVYCAFNRDIVKEIEPELKGTGIRAKTFHSLAAGSLYKHLRRTYKTNTNKSDVDVNKYRNIIDSQLPPNADKLFEEAAEGFDDVTAIDVRKLFLRRANDLIHYLRVKLKDASDIEALRWIMRSYGLDEPEFTTELVGLMLSMAAPALKEGERQLTQECLMDFDDMIYWVVEWDVSVWWNDWVFVDEAQDLSPMQRKMVSKVLDHRNGFIVIVGDPNQAIYRFAGADSDSFDITKKWFKADELPLSVTRRCDKIIAHHAAELVPTFVPMADKQRGKIVWWKEDDFAEIAQPGDLVISRVKAPLINKAIELIKLEKTAVILGGNIGKALIETLEKIVEGAERFQWSDAIKHVETYRDRRVYYWLDRDDEPSADAARDDAAALIALLENSAPTSLDEFQRYVNRLFSDTSGANAIRLCTGHKSKGLQAERVFLLKAEKMPLSYLGMHPEDEQQEENLYYVAITRAKHTLVYLTNDTFLEPYDDGAPIPTYIQYDFQDHEWSPDGLVPLEDWEPPEIDTTLTDDDTLLIEDIETGETMTLNADDIAAAQASDETSTDAAQPVTKLLPDSPIPAEEQHEIAAIVKTAVEDATVETADPEATFDDTALEADETAMAEIEDDAEGKPIEKEVRLHELVNAKKFYPVELARLMVERPDDFLILDFETTDLFPKFGKSEVEPVSVAIINMRGDVLYNSYIMPDGDVAEGASRIHGLTKEALEAKHALHWRLHVEKINGLLKDKFVIAYNSDFDRRVYKETQHRYGTPVVHCNWIDAMMTYVNHNPNKPHPWKSDTFGGWWKLTEALAQEGLEVDDNAHDALADVQMTRRLIEQMATNEADKWTKVAPPKPDTAHVHIRPDLATEAEDDQSVEPPVATTDEDEAPTVLESEPDAEVASAIQPELDGADNLAIVDAATTAASEPTPDSATAADTATDTSIYDKIMILFRKLDHDDLVTLQELMTEVIEEKATA